MKLVDVHCHVNHELFKDDFEEVLAQAKKAGVEHILLSGVNPANNREVLDLCRKHEILQASLGIYPIDALGLATEGGGLPHHEGKIDLASEFAFIEKHKDEVAAIGEVGMDFKWAGKETLAEQQDNFREIVRFALRLGRPIIIHSRKAELECIDIIEELDACSKIGVDLHAFGGNKKLVMRARDLGMYFSIPPSVVNSQHFQMIVDLVPLSQLLTETDSPYLGPERGERNEPAHIVKSVEKIAEIKQISFNEASKAIWQNYLRFLG